MCSGITAAIFKRGGEKTDAAPSPLLLLLLLPLVFYLQAALVSLQTDSKTQQRSQLGCQGQPGRATSHKLRQVVRSCVMGRMINGEKPNTVKHFVGILMRPQQKNGVGFGARGSNCSFYRLFWSLVGYMIINMCLTINSLASWSICFCFGYLTMIPPDFCSVKHPRVSVSLSVILLFSMFNLSLMLFHAVNIIPPPHLWPSSLIFKLYCSAMLFLSLQ